LAAARHSSGTEDLPDPDAEEDPSVLNYNSPSDIHRTVEQLGLRLQKRWGQNFLINQGARRQIVSLIDPGSDQTIWEIGPGLGTLTVLLLKEVRSLLVFEIDRGLVRYLKGAFSDRENFQIVEGDVLKTWKSHYSEKNPPDKIAGNLPYSSASALIAALAENRVSPQRLVFTIQRELAQRMSATPGNKNYSSFSVLCQTVYNVSQRLQLKPGSFYPAPEVQSTVVVLEPKPEASQIPNWGFFRRCLRVMFRSRRKTLRNNLMAGGLVPSARLQDLDGFFEESGIDPGIRSERLSPPELLGFSQRLYAELENL
jgi:16S rRNA (adenine1518-N6/adenine1519-N6)-dimethyltransferase